MNDNQSTLNADTELPEDFDGVFTFTNPTNEEFVGVWAKREYHFAPRSTSPIIILDASPRQIQQIRKKFARDLAEKMFWNSKEYKLLAKQEGTMGNRNLSSIHQAGQYGLNELAPYIQMCLEPLEESRAKVTKAPFVPLESTLTRNDDGELNSGVVDGKTSLKEKALKATGAVSPVAPA